VDIYVLALLVVTPFSFALVAKELGIRLRDIVNWIAPGLISAGIAYGSVWIARGMVGEYSMHAVAQLFVLGLLFSAVYLGLVMMIASASVQETVKLMRRPV
jgi:hypothetical protein